MYPSSADLRGGGDWRGEVHLTSSLNFSQGGKLFVRARNTTEMSKGHGLSQRTLKTCHSSIYVKMANFSSGKEIEGKKKKRAVSTYCAFLRIASKKLVEGLRQRLP